MRNSKMIILDFRKKNIFNQLLFQLSNLSKEFVYPTTGGNKSQVQNIWKNLTINYSYSLMRHFKGMLYRLMRNIKTLKY